MNIFKAIGTVLNSATATIVEVGAACETTARTVNKTVGMAEDAVDAMRKEQQRELAAIQKQLDEASNSSTPEESESKDK